MNDTEIITILYDKLSIQTGRHLYGVLGTYQAIRRFKENIQGVNMPAGGPFPAPLSVTRGILDAIPDTEFRALVEREAKMPAPTAAHVLQAFETFLRDVLKHENFVILEYLEILFAYRCELSLLRTLPTDDKHVLLLLPGRRERDRIIMYPEQTDAEFMLPSTLIAENHLWELKD